MNKIVSIAVLALASLSCENFGKDFDRNSRIIDEKLWLASIEQRTLILSNFGGTIDRQVELPSDIQSVGFVSPSLCGFATPLADSEGLETEFIVESCQGAKVSVGPLRLESRLRQSLDFQWLCSDGSAFVVHERSTLRIYRESGKGFIAQDLAHQPRAFAVARSMIFYLVDLASGPGVVSVSAEGQTTDLAWIELPEDSNGLLVAGEGSKLLSFRFSDQFGPLQNLMVHDLTNNKSRTSPYSEGIGLSRAFDLTPIPGTQLVLVQSHDGGLEHWDGSGIVTNFDLWNLEDSSVVYLRSNFGRYSPMIKTGADEDSMCEIASSNSGLFSLLRERVRADDSDDS